jgi:hypothetical protein
VPDPANLDVLMLAAGACYEDSTTAILACAQGWSFFAAPNAEITKRGSDLDLLMSWKIEI